MGCTSSKKIKKHTTSVEDVSQQKEAVQPNDTKAPPSKNGQVAKQNNAIQIPGANKSFLAPDGIPFIDEDIEDDDDINVTNASDVQVDVGNSISPHGGKTVVQTTTTTTTKSSGALENGYGDSVTVTKTSHQIETSEPRPDVIGQILAEEKHRGTEKSERTFAEVTNNNTSPGEDVAAVRIQAGVRGYLDRKKVKAMRAEHEHHNGVDQSMEAGDSRHVLGDKTVEVRYDVDETDDPKLNSAATRIQANYKGYKTRKELSLKK